VTILFLPTDAKDMTQHGSRRATYNIRAARQRAANAREEAHQQRSATAVRKAQFDETHARAVRSLEEHDFEQFGRAIQEEMAIIEDQRNALDATMMRQRKKR
jgi:hypothetical protein